MRLSGVSRGGRVQVFASGHAQNSRKQLVAMGFYRDISKRTRAMCFNTDFFVHFIFTIFTFSLVCKQTNKNQYHFHLKLR